MRPVSADQLIELVAKALTTLGSGPPDLNLGGTSATVEP